MAGDMKSHISEQSESEPRYSWLHEELAEYSIHSDHIVHCENVLIVREGFTTKDIFASTPRVKITHEYLESIGITFLGIQSVIIAVHKKLCEELSCSELAKVSPCVLTWLHAKLNSVQTLPHLQKECEWKLVVQEGITSKDLFASLPENVFNSTYLKKIGIEALGLQHVLLEWHAELHFVYLQQLNFMARYRNDTAMNCRNDNKRRAENNRNARGDRTVYGGAPGSGSAGHSSHAHKRSRYEANEAE